ncbi:cupin domain-containing protein [Nocardia donostiensis]|uniref:Cupin type-2 domain-containing protein n=1 Tax=Nocardia donostiensis TaxID=1538463 RepID=A0A1V2TFA1_9NOCA|nr:cupin domain-containing protein [Nocardia donostiensis]ONM48175.1 hypothetical protein B0T46_14430 [Nocardia donostiensis]OQS13833.1 hypothetical protein B0T36_16950 [Nocardia donostiensis]OQS16038.1 hypothetical protein B0T44_25795 [Nocardia donostiensis]
MRKTDQRTDVHIEETRLPTVRHKKEGLHVASVGNVYRFLATGDETDGRYSLFETTLPSGEGAPFHWHTREEEAFYVLDGEVAFYTSEERVLARPGTFLNMPVGFVRGFRNEAERDARMLILVAPAGLEGMFLEDGVVLEHPEASAPPVSAEAKECPLTGRKYGIEYLARPLPNPPRAGH